MSQENTKRQDYSCRIHSALMPHLCFSELKVKKGQNIWLFPHICIFRFVTTYKERNRKHDSLYADRATVQTRRWSATRFLGGAWEWALSSGKKLRVESM